MTTHPVHPSVTDTLYPTLLDHRDFLDDRVNYGLATDDPDRIPVAILAGTQAVIDTCCPGFAWVRVIRTFPTVSFPTPATSRVGCPSTLFAAEIELGVTRCALDVLDESGGWSLGHKEADSLQVHLDRTALLQTVVCDIAPACDCNTIQLGTWLPLPTTDCVGSTLTYTIAYDLCCDVISEV
jgi:hypothetical protein